jgi:predicted secreted protein
MSITGALILFSVTWFMVFFCVLPVRFQAQADRGEVTPGTPASAPENAMIGKKARITTLIAAVIFALLYLVINSGSITIDNMDVFHVMG